MPSEFPSPVNLAPYHSKGCDYPTDAEKKAIETQMGLSPVVPAPKITLTPEQQIELDEALTSQDEGNDIGTETGLLRMRLRHSIRASTLTTTDELPPDTEKKVDVRSSTW